MKSTNCYMPSWQSGKFVKKGSYCNWESVLAHADKNRNDGIIELDEYGKIREYIKERIGGNYYHPLPDVSRFHYSFLEHFEDEEEHWKKEHDKPQNWTMDEYHKECCRVVDDVDAVRILANGDVQEIIMDPFRGEIQFSHYIPAHTMAPYSQDSPTIVSFAAAKRPKQLKDVDVLVYYWSGKNGLQFNTTASNLFKEQIYGDVILVYRTTETSFKPRERLRSFYKKDFESLYGRKRKKGCCESVGMSVEEYGSIKQKMQSSLNGYEERFSSLGERPQDLARGAAMPPTSGKDLKEVALLKGHILAETKVGVVPVEAA